MIEDESNNKVIWWSDAGDSFVVNPTQDFQTVLAYVDDTAIEVVTLTGLGIFSNIRIPNHSYDSSTCMAFTKACDNHSHI